MHSSCLSISFLCVHLLCICHKIGKTKVFIVASYGLAAFVVLGCLWQLCSVASGSAVAWYFSRWHWQPV